MSHYSKLDHIIHDIGLPGQAPSISTTDACLFMSGLKKLAADDGAAEQAAVVGGEASMEEGEAQYQAGVPDTTGRLEGEFAVPIEQVVQLMAQIVAHKLKAQMAYLFYGQTLRDTAREGMARLFVGLARGNARSISYFMRRIAVLQPGGIQLPVAPMPEPLHDAKKILEVLVAIEQQGIVTLKHLRSMLGENPMKFTVEEMLSHEQEHLDSLWQFMPPKIPKKQQQKMAGAIKLAAAKLANPQQPVPSADATVIPQPGTESPEAAQLREAQLQAQEAVGAAEHQAQRAQQLEQQVLSSQAAAESAQAQAQMSAQQTEQSNQAAAEAQAQTQQATQQAAASEENAAQQAEAKMRLGMRIQQLRQQLVDIVSSDPVQEEGVGFGEEAGPGAPATAAQKQEQAAAEEQAALEQSATGGGKQQKQQQEAARAQQTANQQAAQAGAPAGATA